jgi:putative DNA primase/helicase
MPLLRARAAQRLGETMPDSFNDFPHFSFELRDDGLYQIDRRGIARWIGPPIEMIAFARTGESRDWGRVLRFTDRDGLNREHTFRERDVLKIGTLMEQLAGLGYQVPPDRKDRKALYDYIVRSDPKKRIRNVFRMGWQDDGRYVSPNQVIGAGDDRLRLDQENADAAAKFAVRGTLESWQQHVAPLCSTSSRLVLGICVGLAAPLLDIARIEGGGLHYVGPSSIGKTTILRGVASMMGGNEYVQSWSTTLAAAEETAMGHCDCLLCLDELKQLHENPVEGARRGGALVYMLANGEGRRRSISYRRQTGVGQYRWRVMVLSTGEESLEEHAEAGGLTRLAGETVRLIDVPADAGAGLGIYETLPDGFTEAAKLSDAIVKAAAEHHGTAFLAFVEHVQSELVRDSAALRQRIERLMQRFYEHAEVDPENGLEVRFARRFALAFASGIMAVKWGVLPWEQKLVRDAVLTCYHAAQLKRPPTTLERVEQTVIEIRRRLGKREGIDDVRDQNVATASQKKTKVNGYLIRNQDENSMFAVIPSAFKNWVGNPSWEDEVLQDLENQGLLIRGSDGKRTRQLKIRGVDGRSRYYCFPLRAARKKKSKAEQHLTEFSSQ